MHILSLNELSKNLYIYTKKADAGCVFIYPTDTIYGIGSIITREAIKKIDLAKQRLSGKYYSIIAPSFSRITDNFDVSENIEHEWKERQGKFPKRGLTLLLPLKNSGEKESLSLLSDTHFVGVRFLGNHPIQHFITALGKPFISTSCNISGEDTITSPAQASKHRENFVDIMIEEGTLSGLPSVIINYETKNIIRS